MVETFSAQMVGLLNRHAPSIPFHPKPALISTQPWYTADIDMTSIDAEIANYADKTADNRKAWHQLRNKAN